MVCTCALALTGADNLFARLELLLVSWNPFLPALDAGNWMLASALFGESTNLLGRNGARLRRLHIVSNCGNNTHLAR